MCGIVAYIGSREAQPLLIEGLKRLEYRGYDSAGIAVVNENGIIENYAALRIYLEEKGRKFVTETDTEVLTTLIAELYDGDLEHAVQAALREVTGAYAIAVLCASEPDTLVVARKGSPLIVGVGNGEYIVASDGAAIVSHTSRAVLLEDYQVCKITREGFHTTTLDNVTVTPKIRALEMELEQIELGDHPHYMHKEIFEQPRSLRNTMRGRLDKQEGRIVLGGVGQYARELVRAKRFILTAQGTAMHAAMIGEYLIEDLAKIPCEVDYASELRYRNPIIEEGTVVIAVSQSGETADTIAALQEVTDRGALALGVVNVVGSTIARDTDAGVYLRVGPEIGVASTKAFTGQVAVLAMLAMFLGRRKHMPASQCSQLIDSLERIPDQVEAIVQQSEAIRDMTARYIDKENWLFLGRGVNYPTALEGALKLKEIHAEGMPAAEMKHGPIALINNGMPVVFIANQGAQYDKVISNIEQVRSRGGRVIAVATEGDKQIKTVADDVVYIPDIPEPLSPLLTVVPLQLLAYHAAVLRGHDVDKPRNLAKSVTVE